MVKKQVLESKKGQKSEEKKTPKNDIKSELDNLFKSKKKKESKVAPSAAATEVSSKSKTIKKDKKEDDSKSKQKKARFTEEGYRIYTVDDLKIGKGGDTEDCPFDCECCF